MTRCLGRGFAFVVALGAMSTLVREADANGRFPRAQYLKELPTDSNRLILSATYGLLSSSDRGKNWYLTCERSLFGVLPEQTDEVDPLLELMPSGTILSGSHHALRVSRDGACTFTTDTTLPVDPSFPGTGKPNDQGAVQDVSLERIKGNNAAIALVVRANDGGAPATFQIYETLDDGVTWQPLGQPIPSSLSRTALTVDISPTDANRIYVSGQPRSVIDPDVLLVSEDRGQTWTARNIPGSEDSYGTYIAAISPINPDVVYARTDHWLPDDTTGGQMGEDILFVSTDAGRTWTELLRKKGKLLGFALSPDGATVLAGYGDPGMPDGREVDREVLGLYRAPAGTVTFQHIFRASVTCLTWNATGVYACASQRDDGFHLGFARDVNFDLTTPSPLELLLKLPDVFGPLPWAPGNSGDVCMQDWVESLNGPAVCRPLGACRDGGVPMASSPVCGDGRGGAGGGAAGRGGSGGAPAEDGGGRGGAAGTGGSPYPGDGCDCNVPSAPAGRAAGAWAVLLAVVALAQRRRG